MLCGCKNGQACDPKEIPSIFKKAHSYSGLSHVAACDALRQVGQPGVGTEPLLRFFGVPHGDTSINFEQGSRDGGNTGYISMRGDLEPTGHLSLQLLREIAKKDSALAAQLNPFLGNLESSLNFGSAYGKSATKFLNGKGWEEFVKFTQDRMLTREFKQKDLYSLCSYLSSKAAKEIKLLDRHRDKCANCRDKNSPPVELDLEKCAEIKPGLKTAAKDIFTRFRCETCHDDPSGSVARVHPGIPYIPFLNAKALCKEQESSLNSYDNLFAKIKGAVDAANTTYRTMPYNARASTLQDEEREIIENYLNRLCKP